MRKIATATILATVITGITSGCATQYADVPTPTRFANSKQEKLQAAQHWKVIADHFAEQIAGDLFGRTDGLISGEWRGLPLYIPQPGGEQRFVQGFRELLITSLAQKKIPLSTSANNALTVDLSYSIYRFSADRQANTYTYGKLTVLAAGVWALGGVLAAPGSSHAGVEAGSKLLATAAAFDGYKAFNDEVLGEGQIAGGPVPRSEIILTSSIVDKSRIISRISNIYYTSDNERELYWDKPSTAVPVAAPATTIKVTGNDCGGGQTCVR